MISMKLSTLILVVLHLFFIVLMLIVLNRHYNKSSFNCPFCELFWAAFSCKNNCFHLTNSRFTFRLRRPQWVRCTLLAFEGSSKFMAMLQRAHEDRGWSGECLRLNPNLFNRGSCSSVGIQTCMKYSRRIDFYSVDNVHGRTLVW